LQEALVQDYDGLIRVAPAVPPGWDFDGSVYVRGKTKVDVQTRNGAVVTLVIEGGSDQSLKIRNPWPGKPVDVTAANNGKKVVSEAAGPVIEFAATTGESYVIEQHGAAPANGRSAMINGTPASQARKLGPVQIGLFPNSQ